MANANPPPGIRNMPKDWFDDPAKRAYHEHIIILMRQLWNRTGGGEDTVTTTTVRETYPWDIDLEGNENNSHLYGSLEAETEASFNPFFEPEPFSWFETSQSSNYTLTAGEWATFTASATATLPQYPKQGDRIRVTKGVRCVSFNGNGNKLNGFSAGVLPGATGSVIELEFSVLNEEWQMV